MPSAFGFSGSVERQQVLCITHLPQIAARPATHFHIAKEVRGGRTTTRVTRLDAGGRELEIARMIAGAEVTPQVLASAKELDRDSDAGRNKSKSETVIRAGAGESERSARGA